MSDNKHEDFVFGRENYKWILIGIGLTLLGFILMIGGATDDPTKFNGDEIFSFRRITLAPMLVIGGYAVVLWGILKKRKIKKNEEATISSQESESLDG